jgi:hypothetical protein
MEVNKISKDLFFLYERRLYILGPFTFLGIHSLSLSLVFEIMQQMLINYNIQSLDL